MGVSARRTNWDGIGHNSDLTTHGILWHKVGLTPFQWIITKCDSTLVSGSMKQHFYQSCYCPHKSCLFIHWENPKILRIDANDSQRCKLVHATSWICLKMIWKIDTNVWIIMQVTIVHAFQRCQPWWQIFTSQTNSKCFQSQTAQSISSGDHGTCGIK